LSWACLEGRIDAFPEFSFQGENITVGEFEEVSRPGLSYVRFASLSLTLLSQVQDFTIYSPTK
jgi:hypothetical protein